MLLTNHSMTGVVLGLSIDDPIILAPAAVVSHLVLDSTPHFGIPKLNFRSLKGFIIGSIDFGLSLLVLALALVLFPGRRGLVALGWLGAVSPDLLYLPEIFLKKRISGKFGDFHSWVQWSETIWPGALTDAAWATLMVVIILERVRSCYT
jgi:hypothetical protein